MTEQEILEKAIKKATKRGWKHAGLELATTKGSMLEFEAEDWRKMIEQDGYQHIIFNHGFAQALWGKTWTQPENTIWGVMDVTYEPWKRHLAEMAIADNPLKYLGENI